MLIRSKLALSLSLLVAGIIAALTLTPVSAPELQSVKHIDKVYHALAFAGLVLPIALFRPDWLSVTVPVCAAFGALIEIVQPFVGRDRNLGDWSADLIGVGLGVAIAFAATAVIHATQQA